MAVEAARSPRLPTVCPFVAFDDERDLRSAIPDRRHRCYAVIEPEPRALAHQERYCLSPTFTSCPIFQDWAAREAAHVAPGEERVGPAAAAPSGLFDEAPAAAASARAALAERGAPADRAMAATSRPGWVGQREIANDDLDDEDAVAAGAAAASAAAADREWDRPRRRRDYPALRSRGTPRLFTAIVVLAVAALALFFLPTVLLALFGGGGGPVGASSTPAASGSATAPAASATAEASGVPSPTPLTYVIQKGDNLTKIATKFNTTVSAILAANPDIKNANSIAAGQTIVIPTLGAPGASASPSP